MAKTTANGCTEKEALAAAEKAGELMDRYSLCLSDVEIQQQRCLQKQGTDTRHDVIIVSGAIARFCGCKAWIDGGRIQYFGMSIDVDLASYLTHLCRSAMDLEFRIFLRSLKRCKVDGRTRRKSFMVAMADRLHERLSKMSEDREVSAKTATGTSLVVVRDAAVSEQLESLGMKFRKMKSSRFIPYSDALDAGREAADKVNLVSGLPGAKKGSSLIGILGLEGC